MAGAVARVLFYPTLAYNKLMSGISAREWYTRIDDAVILGALPFRSMTESLATRENVKGVISMNEPYELRYFYNSEEEWKCWGIKCLKLPTTDYVGVPRMVDIASALLFIDEIKADKGSAYIHCKAGRMRSATVVACYLIKAAGLRPREAIDLIKQKRPHVILRQPHMDIIHKFYDSVKLNAQNGLFQPRKQAH